MSSKKILLMVGVAMLAALVFSVAAQATEEGKMYDVKTESELSQHTEVGMTGKEKYTPFKGAPGNWIECTVHLVFTTEDGKDATSKIKSYQVTTGEKCVGKGIYENCIVKTTETTGLPWTVDMGAKKIVVKDKTIDFKKFEAKPGKTCTTKFINLYFKEETMTPDKLKGFTSFTESGTDETEAETEKTEKGEGEASINLEVEGEAKETYGLEE
jgi:hypothetical protein